MYLSYIKHKESFPGFSLKGSLLEYNVVSAGDLARDGQRIDEVVDNDDDGVRSVGEHLTVELTEHDDTT